MERQVGKPAIYPIVRERLGAGRLLRVFDDPRMR